jgi:hypothetical protein
LESLSDQAKEYIEKLIKGLALFNKAVDWKNVPRSKMDS